MKGWKKKVIILLWVSIFTIGSVGSMEVQAKSESSSSVNGSLSNAQQEKQQLESALQEAKSLISDLQNSQDDIQSKIAQLDTKMTNISKQINDMEAELDEKNAEISDTQNMLAQSEESAATQYASMKIRIQYMYENSTNMSYAELLFSSNNISDFLNSADYIYQLSEYDRGMLVQYQNTTQLIADTKVQLEQDYADLEDMQDELQDQKDAVAALKQEKESELASVGSQIDSAEDTAQAYEDEIAAQDEVINEIKAQLAAVAAKEAAEKAAAEKATADKAKGDGSTNSTENTGTTTTPSYSGGAFTWPCPSSTRVTSDYGSRISPTAGASSSHKGIDIGASYGASIVAAASGEVIFAGFSKAAGNHVIISHGNGLMTVYMHASSLSVSVGETVSAGQTIAQVGSTGVSTGNHLHFGVSVNGEYVSPWNYLS